MSGIGQTPITEFAMNPITRENRFRSTSPVTGTGPACSPHPARLQAIHDLIRSGDYHVPATAIADRMVEQMLSTRRRRVS
jgi:anti-sigma28 factor (negative regulator of flagellin synthesis)